jgi:Domain of unknown function (DUF4476)
LPRLALLANALVANALGTLRARCLEKNIQMTLFPKLMFVLLLGTTRASPATASVFLADNVSGGLVVVLAPCEAGALSPAVFEAQVQALASRAFEATRLSLAREMLTQQCLTAQQLRRVLDFFAFEQTRLELAKMAYANIHNKSDFHVVYSAFQFPASVADLEAYVARLR